MAADPNAVEQVVSRTLRDNLEKIQRTADELHQAVNDMVAACASSRASNALPSMIRAQTSAASLAATLEVLSRFVTSALQPPVRMPFEPDILRVRSGQSDRTISQQAEWIQTLVDDLGDPSAFVTSLADQREPAKLLIFFKWDVGRDLIIPVIAPIALPEDLPVRSRGLISEKPRETE